MITSRFEQLRLEDYALPGSFVDRLLSPALIVYLDHVRENLRRVIRLADGDPDHWRPHVKTTKIPEVYVEMAHAGLRHFKCATTREAAVLLDALDGAGHGGADVLLAYPLVGPALRRLAAIASAHPAARISVLCESPDEVDSIPASVSIFVDVNPGMDRTGVPLSRERTVHEVARRSGERFRGLHFYDGHVHGGDASRRREVSQEGYARLIELAERLTRDGFEIGELITSSTSSFPYALGYEPLKEWNHRVSPGTVVFHDLRTEQEIEDLELRPAALVFSRVVSLPTEDRVTCDAGSKAVAAEAGDPCAYALGHPGLEALTPSEEHLPFRVHTGRRPERGEALFLVPRHVCPTVNLAEQAVLVEGGQVRGIVPVRARAHDLLLD